MLAVYIIWSVGYLYDIIKYALLCKLQVHNSCIHTLYNNYAKIIPIAPFFSPIIETRKKPFCANLRVLRRYNDIALIPDRSISSRPMYAYGYSATEILRVDTYYIYIYTHRDR